MDIEKLKANDTNTVVPLRIFYEGFNRSDIVIGFMNWQLR
jgi:hypothetical protein